MNSDISAFLSKQTCATICVTDNDGHPYCFSCFYAFDKAEEVIYFKSSSESYHVQLFYKSKALAGTIHPDKLQTLLVQGIQFTGFLLAENHSILENASHKYHKRHPLALAKSGKVWAIQLHTIKMTDGTKGFGTKISWKRDMDLLNMEPTTSFH